MLLIISKNDLFSSTLSDMMRYMGVLSYGVRPQEAEYEISPIYSAALVLEDVEERGAMEAVEAIRRKSNIPIFGILSNFSKAEKIFDYSFKGTAYSSRILNEARGYAKRKGVTEIGNYSFGEIFARTDDGGVICGSLRLPLTRVEGNILKFLMRCFPCPKLSDEIIKYVYPVSKKPEKSSLRTHISAINKKFMEILGKNIIFFVEGEGYRIGVGSSCDEFSVKSGI